MLPTLTLRKYICNEFKLYVQGQRVQLTSVFGRGLIKGRGLSSPLKNVFPGLSAKWCYQFHIFNTFVYTTSVRVLKYGSHCITFRQGNGTPSPFQLRNCHKGYIFPLPHRRDYIITHVAITCRLSVNLSNYKQIYMSYVLSNTCEI